jgi:hypothetical protein
MWLGRENCGDCMGGGAGWARFLLLNHWDLFRQEMPIDKVALRCIVEVCESQCRISRDLLMTLARSHGPALRALPEGAKGRLRCASRNLHSQSEGESAATAKKLLRVLDSESP